MAPVIETCQLTVVTLLLLTTTIKSAKLPKNEDSTDSTQISTAVTTVPGSASTVASLPDSSVTVSCNAEAMLVSVKLDDQKSGGYFSNDGYPPVVFNGIIYPSGLGKNSSCMQEYRGATGSLKYAVPLRSCNTMATEMDDGTVEYFNTIVVQPHLKLVTGQGKGYHVRCRYKRRDLQPRVVALNSILSKSDNIRADLLSSDDNELEYNINANGQSESLPSVSMRIYKGDPTLKQVAANVKIGEPLTIVVQLDKQNKFGIVVSDCVVRDGLGWAEQSLINDDGCPLDGEIMGMFQYSEDMTKAQVSFQAHKFPYTASVYYTCNVKLCNKAEKDECEPCSHKKSVGKQVRQKRQSMKSGDDKEDEGSPATIEVFSGLYVNEASDLPEDSEFVSKEKADDAICISQRNFAIGICVAGIILMLAVIAAIAIILARRRRPKSASATGSSLYSGPYTNTGYSHTS